MIEKNTVKEGRFKLFIFRKRVSEVVFQLLKKLFNVEE